MENIEPKKWKVAGINFDHMHIGDLLRNVKNHPNAEIVGVCDETLERMQSTMTALEIPAERQFTDYRQCLERTQPDIAILCPEHGVSRREWVEKVAPSGVNILVEKPFAASLTDADRMIAAVAKTGKTLVVNWPLAWYPPYVTTQRLLIGRALLATCWKSTTTAGIAGRCAMSRTKSRLARRKRRGKNRSRGGIKKRRAAVRCWIILAMARRWEPGFTLAKPRWKYMCMTD